MNQSLNENSIAVPSASNVFPLRGLFVLPLWKLAFMSVVTFGLYELYWAYKNWVAIKHSENSKIHPFLRAFFFNFTAYAMFKRLQIKYPGLLAICYFIVILLWRLPDLWWLMSFSSFLFLLPAQTKINYFQRHEPPPNSLSWKEGLVAAVGLILLALAIAVTFES